MLTVAAFLLALGVLITVHEYGHYKMARWCHIKVLRFSIGLGRPIYSWRFKNNPTEFVIGALPLGGYVKMLDEQEAPVDQSEQHLAFNRQPLAVRSAVVAAGPGANLLLAVLLYACVHWMGVPLVQALINQVVPGGIAQQAGVRAGDVVVRVDEQEVVDAEHLMRLIRTAAGREQVWHIARLHESVHLKIRPELKPGEQVPRVGVYIGGPEATKNVQYGFFDGLWLGGMRTWEMSLLNLTTMGKMLVGQASLKNLGGPLTIAEYAGRSASLGLTAYLSFLALVSVGLGVLNLLPIPLLDGGYLLYYSALAVTGCSLSSTWMARLQRIGLSVLLAITALALFNDIHRLFG